MVDQARAEEDKEVARKLLDRAVENAVIYDEEVDRLEYIISSSLDDIQRRLRISDLRTQLSRLGQPLLRGNNPLPLTRGDPRILERKSGKSQMQRRSSQPGTGPGRGFRDPE